ncbi:hypothetical protein DTW90_36185 [Neorhizobium sp. P12A]|uniref:tyrosine-type recombinase/integrase n=1 Tax=Neorhizobium sp. P12A TaxID=2268027 RepID=UPI0011EF35BF|nr:tyrosine-type recombinase/integrase [Neorhizobium sp. P12A]KAA0684581.1 hypothetical protein DTW90_36185 [Neorhizobium sp. P12A]
MTDVANIDLPYIEQNKSRHDTMRYYLRIDGKRICRLPNDINSEEFAIEYWKHRNATLKPIESDSPKPLLSAIIKQNSFRWLCVEYMASNEFKALDQTTQDRRRNIIESMWIEPLNEKDQRLFADMPLSKMDVGNLEVLRDRKRDTPFAADERLKVLRQVFETTKNGKQIVPNIARLVKPFNVHSDGHATATPEELEQFIEHHGKESKAVLALSILMFTGFRVSDLSLLGPQHRRKDVFHLRLFKNRNRTPVDIKMPIHPLLKAVLSQHKTNAMAYVVTEYGKPFSIKGMGNRISDWFRQAGLGHLTAHSVRKGLATDQAHNEATDTMLEAMFGWKDGKTSKIYTRQADQARLAWAAVEKINWDGIGTKLVDAKEVAEG